MEKRTKTEELLLSVNLKLREKISNIEQGYIVPEYSRQNLIYKALLSLSVTVLNEQMRMNPVSESYDEYEAILNNIAAEIGILADLKKK